jgi:hypothetical protein
MFQPTKELLLNIEQVFVRIYLNYLKKKRKLEFGHVLIIVGEPLMSRILMKAIWKFFNPRC